MKKKTKTISIIGNPKGYTLLEALCAVTVISIGVVLIFPTFFKSANLLAHLSNRFEANLLLENIAAETDSYLRANGNLDDFSLKGKKGFEDGKYACHAEAVPQDRHRESYEVAASVEWTDARKNRLSRTFFITRNV